MTFDERKALARGRVVEFLNRYTPPRGLSDDGQVAMVSAISDAFARRMPVLANDDFTARVDEVLDRVADGHTSYAWPVQGVFVDAMPSAHEGGRKAPETYAIPISAWADRMRRGEAVPEGVVWGIEGCALVDQGEIAAGDLSAYREGSMRKWVSAYAEKGPDLLQARYGSEVERYRMEVSR